MKKDSYSIFQNRETQQKRNQIRKNHGSAYSQI